MTTNRTLAITAIALTAALGLTACQGGTTPTPTDTPAPSSSPSATTEPTPEPTEGEIPELTPPTFETAQSEEEAIDQAVEAINAYFIAVSYLYNAHGEHAERIEDFATGSALAFQQEEIAAIAENGNTVEGAPQISDVIMGTATESEVTGSVVPFGYADITACVDISEYTVTRADGSEVDLGPQEQGRGQFAANFHPETGRWIVEVEEVVQESC